MAGADIPIEELHLVAHVPTIKDIAYMGETEFFSAVQHICLQKEEVIQDEILLSQLTNFQVLMKVLEQSDKNKKRCVMMLLQLLFPDYTPAITKNSIILATASEGREPVLIDDNNFQVFQDAVKEILCVNSIFQKENIIYNPLNAKAKEIADKLMRGRRRAAELKGNENKGESALTRYLSILTIGTQTMSLQDCINLNMFQLFDLVERYTAFVEWDIDLRVRLAGGKPDKQVESWMGDLHPTNSTKGFSEGEIPEGIKVY